MRGRGSTGAASSANSPIESRKPLIRPFGAPSPGGEGERRLVGNGMGNRVRLDLCRKSEANILKLAAGESNSAMGERSPVWANPIRRFSGFTRGDIMEWT